MRKFILNTLGLKKYFDFIKVDIEGAERLLLKGAQGILKVIRNSGVKTDTSQIGIFQLLQI